MFKPKELFIRGYSIPLSDSNLFNLEDPEDQSIVACPQPPIEAVKAGKAVSVPSGEFDISVILEQLPNSFQPEIVNLSARNMNFIPRGLERIKCPKVMKIGDTFHWSDGSLKGIIQYCQTLQCDYHWVYQGVQHLHFFVEAGLKNVFWLPGTPVIEHYIPQNKESKSYDIIFRGSQSELHVHRSRLVKFLQNSKVNIDIQSKPYIECLEDYANSRIAFNCGLNGDTNRRVFEVMMAGGFLLTDRLSSQSGLFSLFQEGVHLECYENEGELLHKIKFYLKNPDKAEKIAAAGHQKLIDCYSQQTVRQKFYRYILEGKIEPPFLLEHDKRVLYINRNGDHKKFSIRLQVYELIQEIHRLNPQIKLLYWKGVNQEMVSDLADLPRLDITYFNLKEAVIEMEAWCSKVGVKDQVHLEYLPSLQKFQIVLLDLPDTLAAIKQLLLEVEPKIANSGFLLIVGDTKRQTKRILNLLARLRGFIPVSLCVAGSQQPLGVGACFVYQKLARGGQVSQESTPKLFVNKLSLKAKVRMQLRSLPLVRQAKKFVKSFLLKKS
ncbi:glycosyltransferase [Scytonema sp. NUACC26]|uniref:glycosyltransferase n=1 Tax=Scytonema sp. NUACC26 TaxID=3140176 RepID=UPI0034DC9DC2